MPNEEIFIAKAPKYRDAGDTSVAGGLDVNVAIAYVDYSFVQTTPGPSYLRRGKFHI